jgi:tetratricopeptide (TPR) repeat protein
VAFDRDATLKKAEKLLRQGRLDAAIAEYVRVVEQQPRDWNTANALGDLFIRAGQLERAAEQYSRIAEHFNRDGFYSKAAALYKKILKFKPDDEAVLLQLAEMSAKQGLLADAKAQLSSVAERRRSRGDKTGADEIGIRLGALDPADFDARLNAARLLAEGGSTALAAERFRAISADLFEKKRDAEALAALREAVRINPKDVGGRAQLAKAYMSSGDIASAREFLDAEAAADDPGLLVAVIAGELREGHLEEAQPLVARVLERDPAMVNEIVNIGWSFCQSNPDAAFMCIDAAAALAVTQGDYQTAASILQEYVARATQQVPALLKLVEVCVDGGLEEAMYETQAQLCDAYLSAGQASEARVIAEDLVAREPWEPSHIQRFRQALVLMKVPDPDTVIAERLNGQVPFVATDRFPGADLGPVVPMPPETGSEPPRAPEPGPDSQGTEPAATSAPASPAASKAREQRQEIDLDALHAMLREIEATESPASHTEIDLTGELLSLDEAAPSGAPPASLDEVFARARDNVAKQPGAEEAAEQLKLAKTCLDMGLTDEAIKAFEHAARAPRQRFEASAALGRLYKQRNEIPLAVEWMERAAEAPAPSAEEGRLLLYDLGVTLEQSRENARALAVFMELLADAGAFRDVQARVDRLSRVETGS